MKTKIEHLKSTSDRLDNLLSDLKYITSDNRTRLDGIGREALGIMEDLNEKGLLHTGFDIGSIKHTLSKEVNIAVNYIKYKDSQRKKDDAVLEAIKFLRHDINMFKMSVDREIHKLNSNEE